MEVMIIIYLFVLGIVLGSFYNVVGIRITDGMSIVKPGSRCPNCNHELRWYELIPLFSYLFLKGKCHSCGVKISMRYFVFELLTGLLFVYSYIMIDLNWELLVILTFISLFVIISVSDFEYMIIEDIVLLIFLVIFLIERYFITLPLEFWGFNLNPHIISLLGGVIGFGLLYIIAVIGGKYYKKEVMGGGDIKLYGIIGIVLGIKLTFLSLFLASLFGAVIGIILIKTKIINRETPVPFGPFIAIGSLVAYFYGIEILQWYTGVLGM